jgi:hypothetical protein
LDAAIAKAVGFLFFHFHGYELGMLHNKTLRHYYATLWHF